MLCALVLSGESWHSDVSEMCRSPALTQVPSPRLAQRLTQGHSQPGGPQKQWCHIPRPSSTGLLLAPVSIQADIFSISQEKTPGGLPQACKRQGHTPSRSCAQKAGNIPPTSCPPHVFPAALRAGGPHKERASPTSLRAALTFPCVLPAPGVTAGHRTVPAGSWRGGGGGGGNAGRS